MKWFYIVALATACGGEPDGACVLRNTQPPVSDRCDEAVSQDECESRESVSGNWTWHCGESCEDAEGLVDIDLFGRKCN